MPVQKLKEYLDQNNVDYVTINHDYTECASHTAATTHIPGKEIAKTVIIRVRGDLAMAVLPAGFLIDFQKLQEALTIYDVSLADEAEFGEHFPNCDLGAMPPFGNLYGMNVYVAEPITEDETIAFCAGSHTELVQMKYADFERLVQPKIVSFSRARHLLFAY